AEGRPVGHLHPGEVDAPAGQELEVLLGEIGADHRRELDVREEGGGVREEGGRAAERVSDLAEGRPHVVEGHGPGDQEISHGALAFASGSWSRAEGHGAAPPDSAAARSGPAWRAGSTSRSGGPAGGEPSRETPRAR